MDVQNGTAVSHENNCVMECIMSTWAYGRQQAADLRGQMQGRLWGDTADCGVILWGDMFNLNSFQGPFILLNFAQFCIFMTF